MTDVPLRDAIIVAVLVVWFIASVLAQPRASFLAKTRWRNFAGLLPNYRFFAPVPIAFDYQIFYRLVREGVAGEWIPLDVPAKPSYCWLWNPQQRLKKAVNDLVTSLHRYRQPGLIDKIPASYAYVLILNHVKSLARSEGASVQFIVTQTKGFEDKEEHVFFASHAHPLSD
jgi:hypothetical protein